MSLLRELYEEASCGATGGASVAALAEPMLATPKRRLKIGNLFKLHKPKKRKRLKETFDYGDFDPSNVLSKLDAAEKKSKYQEDTVTFGLEDEKGNVVRVIVDGNQAKQFEVTLAKMLGDQHNDTIENYNGTPTKEIAEILFQLKHQFNIIDVKWGDLPVDEEEEPSKEDVDMEAQNQDMDQSDNQDGIDMDSAPEDMDVDGGVDMGVPQQSNNDESGLLQKVIDMMKTDAEARKAEAQAREAEAKATVSKYSTDAALAKVKQEEDVLDMEAYYKDKQQQDKESKTLAKLAKYKHDVAGEQGNSLSSSEDEEGHVSLSKLSDLIISRLKGR